VGKGVELGGVYDRARVVTVTRGDPSTPRLPANLG
jgi:hypothetical protein